MAALAKLSPQVAISPVHDEQAATQAEASESAEEDRQRQNQLHTRNLQKDNSAPRSSLQQTWELKAERS
jgi:hypothetical protein